jgi:signal transduction histidine kinase
MQELPTAENYVLPATALNRSAEHLKLLADISRILIAGDNLPDLLGMVLERTVAVIGATRGSILLLDPNAAAGSMIRAGAGISSAPPQVVRVLRKGAAGYAIRTRQPVVIHDTRSDSRWIPSTIDQQHPAPRSALIVPLLDDADVKGVITLWHISPDFFEPNSVELLTTIAAQAAVAIERTTAYEQLRRRVAELDQLYRERDQLYAQEHRNRRNLAMLYEASLIIAAAPTLPGILRRFQDCIKGIVSLDDSLVFLYDAASTVISRPNPHLPHAPLPAQFAAASRLASEAIARGRTIMLQPDAAGDMACQAMALPFINRAVCNGALVLLRRGTHSALSFSRVEQQLIESLCAPVSVAISNIQLYEDLRQSNTALLRANRLKSEFLATISHELRTPLSNITGYTEMLQEGFYGPLSSELHDPLQRIQRNARQLLAQVEDVLDLSMLEAGYVQINPAPASLETLIRDLLAMFSPLVLERNVQLQASLDAGLDEVIIDVVRLRQVLHHLLANAVKYTYEGRIEITAQLAAAAPGLVIEVLDTGIGIPIDMQQSIFEEFRRIDVSSTRRQGGIGIGLAIVYRLVRLMGGSISLQSEINSGSCFRIELPQPAR